MDIATLRYLLNQGSSNQVHYGGAAAGLGSIQVAQHLTKATPILMAVNKLLRQARGVRARVLYDAHSDSVRIERDEDATPSQAIAYGRNLTSVTRRVDYAKLATRVYPI